uniref:Uncharacterized protein n=1 Tax=Oryza sativa subsp. indica TaxID=39946 RepID=A0A679B8V0_ORYSI|nr:hypothetical protein [Oryza sativa Indica Group]
MSMQVNNFMLKTDSPASLSCGRLGGRKNPSRQRLHFLSVASPSPELADGKASGKQGRRRPGSPSSWRIPPRRDVDGAQPTKTLTATRGVTVGWCGEAAAKAGSGHPTHGSSAVAGSGGGTAARSSARQPVQRQHDSPGRSHAPCKSSLPGCRRGALRDQVGGRAR